MSEAVLIRAHRYRDANGRPTCSDAPGRKCMFLEQAVLGRYELCSFFSTPLERRDSESLGAGMGTLIPHQDCPLWTTGIEVASK